MENVLRGVYSEGDLLYTVNHSGNPDVYGERIVKRDGKEFREWIPGRSKPAAAIKKGFDFEIPPEVDMLYLGAATGTTVSHLSDIMRNGFIYAVEKAREPARDLLRLAERRENIAPVIHDATSPQEYPGFVEPADILYQDIAQKNQVSIFRKNAEELLKEGGKGYLALKTRAVSSTKNPSEILEEAWKRLEPLKVVESMELDPYARDHYLVKIEKKGSGR